MEKITKNKIISDIYKMELHDKITVSDPSRVGLMEIIRVPGGWVYSLDYPGYGQSPTVFVPFNNEFENKK